VGTQVEHGKPLKAPKKQAARAEVDVG